MNRQRAPARDRVDERHQPANARGFAVVTQRQMLPPLPVISLVSRQIDGEWRPAHADQEQRADGANEEQDFVEKSPRFP